MTSHKHGPPSALSHPLEGHRKSGIVAQRWQGQLKGIDKFGLGWQRVPTSMRQRLFSPTSPQENPGVEPQSSGCACAVSSACAFGDLRRYPVVTPLTASGSSSPARLSPAGGCMQAEGPPPAQNVTRPFSHGLGHCALEGLLTTTVDAFPERAYISPLAGLDIPLRRFPLSPNRD